MANDWRRESDKEVAQLSEPEYRHQWFCGGQKPCACTDLWKAGGWKDAIDYERPNQERIAALETENARLQARVERLAYERVKTGHGGDAVFCRHCGYGYVEPDEPCHEPDCIVTEVTDDNEV